MDNNSEPLSGVTGSVKQEQLSWSMLGVGVYVKILVIAGLLFLFFYEEIATVVGKWSDPSWSHGILIPFFSLYFLNQHKDKILRLESSPNYLGLVLLLCCLVFYPINYMHIKIAYALPLTAIAASGSAVLFLGGWKLIKYTWLPIAYLVFAVPLPARLLTQLTTPMRIFASHVSSALLNLISGMEATARGAVIDVVYKGVPLVPSLDVADACSGMRLLMTFVALGVAMAYLHYRPIWQRLVLLCSTIPIAIICNVIRVTITGLIYILWDPKYAKGIYHDMLGMMMLPLAFGLYAGIAWFMANLFVDESVSSKSPEEDIIVRRKDT